MRDLNWRFALEFNKLHKRKGHFYQARYRCSVIDNDEYEKVCHRYIYRNQVRAGMVPNARRSKWSSFHYYASGKKDPLITPFRNFMSFGMKKKLRQLQFRQFVETMTSNEEWEWKQRINHWNLRSKKEVLSNYLLKSGEG